MKLGTLERSYYNNLWQKSAKTAGLIQEKDWKDLLEQSVDDQIACQKIWENVVDGSSKTALNKEKFFALLFYIAAYQQRYSLDADIESLPKLKLPNLNFSNLEFLSAVENGDEYSEEDSQGSLPSSYESNKSRKELAEPKADTEDLSLKKLKTNTEKISPILGPSADPDIKKNNSQSNDFNDFYLDEAVEVTPRQKATNVTKSSLSKLLNTTNDSTIDTQVDCSFLTNASVEENFKEYAKLTLAEYHACQEKIKININGTKTHTTGLFGYNTYVTYIIRVIDVEGYKSEVERRYSDFDWLDNYLNSRVEYKGFIFPELPSKKSVGNKEEEFVKQRQKELEEYLRALSRHEKIINDKVLKSFLGERGMPNFNNVKSQHQPSFISHIPEMDLNTVFGTYEYVVASFKAKLKKGDIYYELNKMHEKTKDVIQIHVKVNDLKSTLEKHMDKLEKAEAISEKLNLLNTKILNRVSDQKYKPFAFLTHVVSMSSNKTREIKVYQDLLEKVSTFKQRLIGFQRAYSVLISILQEIQTNKELLKDKKEKILRKKIDDNNSGMDEAIKSFNDVEKKIYDLEHEIPKVKDNLSFEIENIKREGFVFLNEILNDYHQSMQTLTNTTRQNWNNL